jgi:phosphoserine phosphatase
MVTVHHQQGRLVHSSCIIVEAQTWEDLPRSLKPQSMPDSTRQPMMFHCAKRQFHLVRQASAELIDRTREAIMRGATAAVIAEDVRMPKALFFDMDATVIKEESLVEIAKVSGKEKEIAALTEQAMAGGMEFKESLRQRLAILKGLTRDQVLAIKPTICPGMSELVLWAKERSIPLFLVSGGFVDLAEPIARHLGFRDFKANRFAWDGDVMTGQCDGVIIDSQGKRDAVLNWCKHLQISPKDAAVIGDGANDRLMMEISGLAVGFCPKKTLWPMLDVANHTGDHRFLVKCLEVSVSKTCGTS